MNSTNDSQGDESSYQEQVYYDVPDDSINDPDSEYQGDVQERMQLLREQDRFLPIANVSKIMKRAIPLNGKIAKDAKECVQECVSEFISFITSEAAERCQTEKRKTINGEDILFAMNTLGFENYVEPLKIFLVKFREASKLDSTMLDETALAAAMQNVPTVQQNAVILSQASMAPQSVITTTLNGTEVSEVSNQHITDLTDDELKPTSTTVTMTGASGAPVTAAFLVPFSGQVAFVNGGTVTTTATG